MSGKPFLALDASIMDAKEHHEAIKLDVELNRISFEFPGGLSTIPLIEECRALNSLDDFDLMYDITMQLLTGKPVRIFLKDYKGDKHLVAEFIVTDRNMDLRGVEFLNSFPVIVNWLAQFVADMLSKKYPRPSEGELQLTAQEKKKQKAKTPLNTK